MGYSHYWEIHSTTKWQQIWFQLVADTCLIVGAARVRLTKEVNSKIIQINGHYEKHEDFILEPTTSSHDFCETARKDYDLVVTAILLRAKQLAGGAIEISSDGEWDDEWEPAQHLVHGLWPEEEICCPWDEEDDEDDEDDEGVAQDFE